MASGHPLEPSDLPCLGCAILQGRSDHFMEYPKRRSAEKDTIGATGFGLRRVPAWFTLSSGKLHWHLRQTTLIFIRCSQACCGSSIYEPTSTIHLSHSLKDARCWGIMMHLGKAEALQELRGLFKHGGGFRVGAEVLEEAVFLAPLPPDSFGTTGEALPLAFGSGTGPFPPPGAWHSAF